MRRSVPSTLRYSQDRIAKKKAPRKHSCVATSSGVKFTFDISHKILGVSAFCPLGAGSEFLYPFKSRSKRKCNFPPSSWHGLGRS